MDADTYRIIHISGLLLAFMGLGAALALRGTEKKRGGAMAAHGIGLFLALLGGFGLHARVYEGTWTNWLIAKLVIWVIIGALPILVKRGMLPGIAAWITGLALGAAGVWLVVAKPF